MHFERQTMAMRIPQRAHMAQEARLLLDGQALPNVLKRGANAVDDCLPRCAVRLAAVQAIATAVVRLDSRFERERPESRGMTPFEACGRGNCPCLEITVTLPWNPSRRAREQHVDHGEARADERHGVRAVDPLRWERVEGR